MIVVNDNGDLQDQKRLLHWKKVVVVKTLVIVHLGHLGRKVTVLVGLFDCHLDCIAILYAVSLEYILVEESYSTIRSIKT